MTTPSTSSSTRWQVFSAVRRFTAKYEQLLSKGDQSALRRATPDQIASGAFWRALVGLIESRNYKLSPHEGSRATDERRWSAVISAVVLTHGQHGKIDPSQDFEARDKHFDTLPSLGAALAEAGFSELRFTRLLRARDALLLAEIRRAALFLASKGTRFDPTGFAALAFLQAPPRDEQVRRGLARHFFSALYAQENDLKEND